MKNVFSVETVTRFEVYELVLVCFQAEAIMAHITINQYLQQVTSDPLLCPCDLQGAPPYSHIRFKSLPKYQVHQVRTRVFGSLDLASSPPESGRTQCMCSSV